MRPFSHEPEASGPAGCRPCSGGAAGCGEEADVAAEADVAERGSAVVEFTFLSLLLMVPLVYFIITVGQLQGGSFAVVGAADQAAKIYVSQPDAASGRAAAEQAVLIALADYGQPAENAIIDTSCEPSDCMSAGSAVTVTVHLTVPLPFVPFSDALHLTAGHLTASATQMVGRFK
jgi:Flp pilus assembly protein TadG